MPVRINELANPLEPLDPDRRVSEALQVFLDRQNLTAIPVVLDGLPVGLLRRDKLLDTYIRASDELAELPLTRLMDTAPMIGEGDTPVAYLAQLQPEDGLSALEAGVIVTEDGLYSGYANALAISQAVAAENADRARVMKRRKAAVAKPTAAPMRAMPAHDWVGMLAYQLRAPLHDMLGLGELLGMQGLKGDAKDWASTISSTAQQLDNLLQDMLLLAGAPDSPGGAGEQAFDLKLFCQSLLELWRPRTLTTGVSLKLNIHKTTPQRIRADGSRLRQVLSGLIGNALSHAEKGTTVSVKVSTNEASHLVVTIAMPAAVSGKLTPPTPGDAAGILGRQLAEQIAEAAGGTIDQHDQPDGASVVTLTYPAVAAEPRLAVTNAPAPTRRTFQLGEILIADDHEVSAMIVKTALAGAGWSVTLASDGEEALDLAQARSFQAVLLDRHMPGLSGPEVAEALRAGQGPNSGAPIISLSADPWTDDELVRSGRSFSAHINKPIRPGDLVAAVSDAILTAPPRELTRRMNAV